MPKLYGNQIDVQGEAWPDQVPLTNPSTIIVDGVSGEVDLELQIDECEGTDSSTDTGTHDGEVKEGVEGTHTTRVTITLTPEEKSGVVGIELVDTDPTEEISGTVDTEISDDGIKEGEDGITVCDLMTDEIPAEQAGTINRELGLEPSCCINE